jgi:uncharacterized membrane protein YfcA
VPEQWVSYLALCGVGLVSGTLNVIAGGGSFLSLPVLIFFGLPPTVANGTNRVGILLQNLGAVWGFSRHGVLDWRWVLWGALPASVGAVAGSAAALMVGDQAFKKILAVLMIALTLWTLWDPLKSRKTAGDEESRPPRRLLLAAGFMVVGAYGGFVQAGVGFLVLAATTLAGLDLVRGNAVKVLSILAFTVISLGIFAWSGKVDWTMGGALAIGSLLGGQIGVRLTVLKGHTWIRWVVTVAVIGLAVKLLLPG